MNVMVYSYTIFLIFSRTFAYQWLEFDKKFDCTVGITVDDIPISIGVLITSRTVITSANPLNQYLNSSERIKVHTISKDYKDSVKRSIESVRGNQSFRRQSWVTIGYNDTSHTTIHDIILLNLIDDDKIYKLHGTDRGPFIVDLPYRSKHFDYKGWMFAGFGYIDQDHIDDNSVLEVSYYDAELADCDEWIPREWGRFLCLFDDEGLTGLASGAPLFRTNDVNTVWGIGSFVLKKGQDKVLLFTDLRPYVYKLYGVHYG